MSIPSVTVIGAGIAGLTAAYRLKQHGFSVKVLEARSYPGGRMTQRQEKGLSYNTGARLCYSFYSEVNKLVSELGLQNSVIRQGKMDIACQTENEQYLVSLKPELSLLSHSQLQWSDKLSLLRFLPDLLSARRRVNPGWMTTAIEFDNDTLADYIREKASPAFLEKFVEPVFRATRSWNPEQISPAFFLSTSAQMLYNNFTFTFKEGIGQLTAELASHLEIEYLAEVTEIRRKTGNSKSVIHYCVDEVEKELTTDITICATEGAHVSDLIAEPEQAEEKFFEKIKYNSLGIVHANVTSNIKKNITFYSRQHNSELSIIEFSRVNGKSQLYCQLSPELTAKVKDENKSDHLYPVIQKTLQSLYP